MQTKNDNPSLNQISFAIVDVETTGLSPAYGHRVCEVACLRVQGGVELDRFEALVDPQRPISPGAFRINRITADMLHGAPRFDAVASPLLQRMADAVVVAHNAPFDLGFLGAEFELARLPLPQGPVVDTLALARRAYRFGSNSLSSVARNLGVKAGTAHRAMGDVQTTFGVLQRILLDLGRQGITQLSQLIDFQGGPVLYPDSSLVPLPPTISEALESGGRVHMRYMDARGRETERLVRPLRVSARRGKLYLVAHCYRRDQPRTFRLDRVVEMSLQD